MLQPRARRNYSSRPWSGRSSAPARRIRPQIVCAPPARSKQPMCRCPRRSVDGCSSFASAKAIASKPATSSPGWIRLTRRSRARVKADHDQADAAPPAPYARVEDVRQPRRSRSAEADVRGGRARRRTGRRRSLRGAARLQLQLPQTARRCGHQARRGEARAQGARDRVRAMAEQITRLRRSRREGIGAPAPASPPGRAAATWEGHRRCPSPRRWPASSRTLADVGEILRRAAPVVTVTDLDHVWANVCVDEPVVPRLRLDRPATLFTDAGSAGPRNGELHLLEGRVHAAQRADRRRPLEAR
jgi:hypothetical protein